VTSGQVRSVRLIDAADSKNGQGFERTPISMAEVSQRVIATAEQLYRAATDQTERAEMALEEFDRQSEATLTAASTSVELARQKLRESRMAGNLHGLGDRLAQLEGELKLTQATELIVLNERAEGRAPLERAWRSAAVDLCLWGRELLRAQSGLKSYFVDRVGSEKDPATAVGGDVR